MFTSRCRNVNVLFVRQITEQSLTFYITFIYDIVKCLEWSKCELFFPEHGFNQLLDAHCLR